MGSAHAYNHSYYNSGLTKAKLGDLSGAASDFGAAIAHDPMDAVAFKDRGDVRLRLGDFVGALADFSEAVQLDRRFARARGRLGYTRFRAGDLHGALTECGRALSEDPTESCALSTRGLALAQLARVAQHSPSKGFERDQTDDFFIEAVSDCEEAVNLEPGNAGVLAYLAYVRLLSGDVEGACADSQLALEWDPGNCDARAAHGGVLAAQGNLHRGLQECIEALRSDPGNPLAMERLRVLHEKTSQALGTPMTDERLLAMGCEGPRPDRVRSPLPRATPRAVGRQRDLAFSIPDEDSVSFAETETTEEFQVCGRSQNWLLHCIPERPTTGRRAPHKVLKQFEEDLAVCSPSRMPLEDDFLFV